MRTRITRSDSSDNLRELFVQPNYSLKESRSDGGRAKRGVQVLSQAVVGVSAMMLQGSLIMF